MSIDSLLWSDQVELGERIDSFPRWTCPSCQAGHLRLKANSLHAQEATYSELAYSHEAWEPDWRLSRFAAMLQCDTAKCGEICIVSGFVSPEERYGNSWEEHTYEDVYHIRSVYPAPPVFPIAEECPDVISEEIKKAFSLYWVDKSSAANRLRVAAELLLTEQRIKRFSIKNGKRHQLYLHSRIELYQKKNPEAANLLMAIKWQGNTGSHSAKEKITSDHLLSVFEIFEHLIDLLYVKSAERARKTADEINKRKGKPKPRRRR